MNRARWKYSGEKNWREVEAGHKYRAKKMIVDGIKFASRKEAIRYLDLRALVAANKIKDLKLQVVFQFFRGGIEIGRWVVDFTYLEGDKQIAEDPTGFLTAKKKRNIKLFEEHYPLWELRIT